MGTATCELKFSELKIQDQNKAFFDDQSKGYMRVPLSVLSMYYMFSTHIRRPLFSSNGYNSLSLSIYICIVFL